MSYTLPSTPIKDHILSDSPIYHFLCSLNLSLKGPSTCNLWVLQTKLVFYLCKRENNLIKHTFIFSSTEPNFNIPTIQSIVFLPHNVTQHIHLRIHNNIYIIYLYVFFSFSFSHHVAFSSTYHQRFDVGLGLIAIL